MAREHSRGEGGRGGRGARGGRLEGKAVLISGAGSGMGRSAARLFAREGARVALCDNREPAVAATVDAIRREDGEAVGTVADVSRAAQVAAAVELAVDSYGRLDVLYNNAGVWLPTDGPAPDLDEATWDRIIDVNLKGTFLGCKYAIPHLRAAGGGSIINVSSVSALRAGKDIFDAYAASKGGIISLTCSVASTWGPQRIRANVICPGSIDTPMTAGSYADPEGTRVLAHPHRARPCRRRGRRRADGVVAGLRRVVVRDRRGHRGGRRLPDEVEG